MCQTSWELPLQRNWHQLSEVSSPWNCRGGVLWVSPSDQSQGKKWKFYIYFSIFRLRVWRRRLAYDSWHEYRPTSLNIIQKSSSCPYTSYRPKRHNSILSSSQPLTIYLYPISESEQKPSHVQRHSYCSSYLRVNGLGLTAILSWLIGFRFPILVLIKISFPSLSKDVTLHAVSEGSVVFPRVPLMRVTGMVSTIS